MIVLGIETSCDETGLAIYDTQKGLRAHALFSQIALHQLYGGVVPELASRDHVQRLVPLIKQVCQYAECRLQDLDGLAYTAGPGLIGALLVGAGVGQSLAWALSIPAIAVHHMEGHLLAPLLEHEALTVPFIALLVSGGHTQLLEVRHIGEYTLLGETLDDAAGEALDKTAKLMGLPYPGGPSIAELAKRGRLGVFEFSRPMTDRAGLDFSFSGLKTQALLTYQANCEKPSVKADIARAFQDAVVDTLVIKCRRALSERKIRTLVVAGGVGANTQLREKLQQAGQQHNFHVAFPRAEFCTDNGAMIAFAGALRLQAGQCNASTIQVRARWPMAELTPIN